MSSFDLIWRLIVLLLLSYNKDNDQDNQDQKQSKLGGPTATQFFVFYIKKEDANIINNAKEEGRKVIAIGTTSCRVLETISSEETGLVKATEGDTSIFIYPGYKFKCIDGLITNFHLPQSTLLMLVSALAGREFILRTYEEAVKERYRFFSFGDAMLIL